MEPNFLALKEHGRRSSTRRFRLKTQIIGTPTRRKFPTDPKPKKLSVLISIFIFQNGDLQKVLESALP